MNKERIQLTDSTLDVITKMSEGNPGALTVIMQLLSSEKIDPDSALGGLGNILSLDSYGIYGSDIYIFHNDICDRKINKMIAVLRAVQLGFFSSHKLRTACAKQDRSGKNDVPVDILYQMVKEALPNFDKNNNEV